MKNHTSRQLAFAVFFWRKKIINSPPSSPNLFWQPFFFKKKKIPHKTKKNIEKAYGEGHGAGPISSVGMMVFIII